MRTAVPYGNMFFVHELEQTITIHPSFFGPNIHEHLINKLIHDVEGTNTGSYFIVCIMDQTWQISEGRVIPGSAHAEYTIHYEAVVWKPFKFEVVCKPAWKGGGSVVLMELA